MSQGVSPPFLQIVSGDSAELVAYLRINEQPVTQDQIQGVTFTIQKPDGTTSSPQTGLVQSDGSGYLRWLDTAEIGEYIAQAQFTLLSGEIRSSMIDFTVYDPFVPAEPSETDILIEQVQMRLNDCFDSIEGGPWLRDKSLNNFDYTKVADFIPEALLDINVQMPPSNYTLDDFATGSVEGNINPNLPLLAKGVLVLTIRHLMRSYTEQPTPTGQASLVWADRTRYQQMWNQVYQVEYADYIEKVRLWKRTALNLGHSGLLTFSKAGRLYPYGSQRSRGIYRGYY